MAGMNIFNRPPTISEDTLIYSLYPITYEPNSKSTHSRLARTTTDKCHAIALTALIETNIKDLLNISPSPGENRTFLWHKDPFELRIVNDEIESLTTTQKSVVDEKGWYLEGRMRVGDSVDDEWCAVWLLREISKKWDVAVSVYDSDGEFLLIEAADYLPTWLTPTNAENRVWIYRSHIHLIPLEHVSLISPSQNKRWRKLLSKGLDGYDSDNDIGIDDTRNGQYINVQDALALLIDRETSTFAPAAVEDAIWKRILGYPGALHQHVHIAYAFLPIDVAKALSQEPALVQKAAETFYTRDAIQLRAAQKMSRFPPKDCILSSLTITRTAYAQLMGQKFHPPKAFGQFREKTGSKEWKWRDIGMKLACGFEMLYQEDKVQSQSSQHGDSEIATSLSVARKDILQRSPEYVQYIDNLVKAGYFEGEIRDSYKWKQLEDRAVDVFVSVRQNDDVSRPSFASQVNSAVSRVGHGPPPLPRVEENDDWLVIDTADFDSRLALTGHSQEEVLMEVDSTSNTTIEEEDKATDDQAGKLKDLAQKVQRFVEGKGALEGAMLEDDLLSDDEEMSEFSEEVFSSGESDNRIQEKECVNDAVRQAAMDQLVTGIAPEDYGKMPAIFYRNSQQTAPVTLESESSDSQQKTSSKDISQSTPKKPIRKPILPRDDFDGVDSDDESDEVSNGQDSEDEEDKPQIDGDIEIDMAEEEEEFLKFTREVLGISEDQWRDIVQDRRDRGAFLPDSVLNSNMPRDQYKGHNVPYTGQNQAPQTQIRPSIPNSKLDSFEAVMKAMDLELARTRAEGHLDQNKSTKERSETSVASGKRNNKVEEGRVSPIMKDEDDIDNDMRAELRVALKRDEEESEDEEPANYGLIKNFLESFNSQAGLSGPVSNLAGILQPGFRLPRDNS